MNLQNHNLQNQLFFSNMRNNFRLQIFSRIFVIVLVSIFLITGCKGTGTTKVSGGTDPSNLSVASISPLPGSIGAPVNKNIVVTLNMDVKPNTVSNTTVFIEDPGNNKLSVSITYNENSNVIIVDPSLALLSGTRYTVTLTSDIIASNGTRLASNYSAMFTTVAGDLPPDFSLWESNMITYGAIWGEYQNPDGGVGWSTRFSNAYYDILWNMYQIKEYTGQNEPWDTYISYARSAYRDEYYRAADYDIGEGYQRFSHGLLADYLAGGTTTLADVQKIRDNPAFSNLSEFQNSGYLGQSQNVSREMSYVLQSHINAEKAGEARNTNKVSQYVAWMENHLHEWRSNTYSGEEFFQPFMFALTAHALIEFYEWETLNGRDPNAYWPTTHWATIPEALAAFSSWMYNDALVRLGPRTGQRMWVADFSDPGYGGFRYADREYEEGAGAVYPGLNLLISPVYVWVYKINGDASFRSMGDDVFKGGVRYGNSEASGKEFDQNYRWSFKFVQWRNEADLLWN